MLRTKIRQRFPFSNEVKPWICGFHDGLKWLEIVLLHCQPPCSATSLLLEPHLLEYILFILREYDWISFMEMDRHGFANILIDVFFDAYATSVSTVIVAFYFYFSFPNDIFQERKENRYFNCLLQWILVNRLLVHSCFGLLNLCGTGAGIYIEC